MLQVLQAEMVSWKRDNLSQEEARLRELSEIPIRHSFGADEARRRLLERQTISPAKRRLRSKANAHANSGSKSNANSTSNSKASS